MSGEGGSAREMREGTVRKRNEEGGMEEEEEGVI